MKSSSNYWAVNTLVLGSQLLLLLHPSLCSPVGGQPVQAEKEEPTHRAITTEDDDEEEEETVDRRKLETAIVCIIAFLIIVTILFEAAKERITELSSRSLRPVIEALFGEMTILGFLSACTFVIVKTPWPGQLSESIFGEEELLVEIFEQVHFTVFFIMLFFVAQVIVVVQESKRTEQNWKHCDAGHADAHFAALRHEFILERSLEPPFAPSPNQVPDDFRFGRYLSLCLGRSMAHVVHVQNLSWGFFLIVTFVFYRILLALHNDFKVLAWVWVGVGWLVLALSLWFEHYLLGVLKAYMSPSILINGQNSNHHHDLNLHSNNENETLLEDDRPAWCKVELPEHKKSWLSCCAKHHEEENRQTALLIGGAEGPEVHFFILQILFVFLSIYSTLLILTFIPEIYDKEKILKSLVYIVLAVIPVLAIQRRSRHVLASASIVSSIGFCRRPEVIADVMREAKTARVVRAFIVLDKMQRISLSGNAAPAILGESEGQPVSEMHETELRELGKTFDTLDHSGDGHISTDELGALMYRMGRPLPPEQVDHMVSLFDVNEDGLISREEFLNWYKINLLGRQDNVSLHERAKVLFNLFDRNQSGKISVAEFKTTLDALNVGFTVDEVGLIVREMDEDGNVKIGLSEFTELLEKFYPEELENADHH